VVVVVVLLPLLLPSQARKRKRSAAVQKRAGMRRLEGQREGVKGGAAVMPLRLVEVMVAGEAGAGRVVAAGTTSVRTLESMDSVSGETNIFIYPGYEFKRVGAMLTNFHLPASSLMLLVCAFGGTELMMEAYRYAVKERYRFFSYGDCMLIL